MTKEELLSTLMLMQKEAEDEWYRILKEHDGEWHSTHPQEPMRYRSKTLKEVIELVKELDTDNKCDGETLGARLRNLLTPYKNLIAVYDRGWDITTYMKSAEADLENLIEFSNSPNMEKYPYVNE